MNGVLTLLSIVVCGLVIFAIPVLVVPYSDQYGVITIFETAKAVLLCSALAAIVGWISYRQPASGSFLLKLFISALLVRILLGSIIFAFNGQEFFGGDAITYDFFGNAQLAGWGGDRFQQTQVNRFVGGGIGWGMVHMVGAIYGVIGRNMLAVQLVNSVIGAATAVIIFLCAHEVFGNLRVARLAGLAVAFFPSLVLWSSQGLKDGPVVFFLALSILATLRLGRQLSVKYLVLLVFSLFALLSFRFYVFYMIAIAIGGAFVVGMQPLTQTGFMRQFLVIVLVGLSLTYLGVTRYANIQLERFGSLERVQRSRFDASTRAKSGFAADVDVSTTEGALSTIPVGMLNLLFAPFPWQLASLRQSITLPEMVIWWASFPMLILGLWYSIRYRLRQISPILIFTIMLSLAYSIFQGNVGTAYRQRAQLLVFYFIFVAVGYVLLFERYEERKQQEIAEKEALANRMTTRPRQVIDV